MEKNEAEKRIKKLRNEIARLRGEYHIKNAPNVTDDIYESLSRELKSLLEKYPEFRKIIVFHQALLIYHKLVGHY